MNHEQFAADLAKNWGDKTLRELRDEAEREKTQIAFESFRVAGGKRLFIIICVTDIDQIARLERSLRLVDEVADEDWNTLTLVRAAARTAAASGLAFESEHDEFGRRSALVLIATAPRSIQIIESLFNFPA